jgi:hypothetical protein
MQYYNKTNCSRVTLQLPEDFCTTSGVHLAVSMPYVAAVRFAFLKLYSPDARKSFNYYRRISALW